MTGVNTLRPAERLKIPRQQAIERPPEERCRTFQEVSLGFDEERALVEASRCLECKDAACVKGCPVNVDIRGFIELLLARDHLGAINRIREANALPAVCGRVCPQETQCELMCVLGKKYTPIAIGKLERFAADYEIRHGLLLPPPRAQPGGEQVAIVGSGPSGLACAADLARLGYRVTIFEALHAPGGVLRYGIPEFRLPREVLDLEIQRIEALGVEIVTNVVVGKTATIDELFEEWRFAAVYLATGAGTPHFMGIPGENLVGVYSANEFLTRVNLMQAHRFPDFDTPIKVGRTVAVIGGGNTAVDAVRTARRLGAQQAYLIYRRSRDEMPARREEILHAEEEGVRFILLTTPIRILGGPDNRVCGIECQRIALGEPDMTGRRTPMPIPGSEFILPVQTVIEAIGARVNPIIQTTTPGLESDARGTVVTDETKRTSRPGVFAGGDLARGGATVILAMRDGRVAAASIDEYLRARRQAAHPVGAAAGNVG
ncbi:MAG: NADPH-dependent glutamate synthase [Armatimonadetes bacterium]|nr:NADPH-dependent glutamate synthase [Armatimonadota bacterium]